MDILILAQFTLMGQIDLTHEKSAKQKAIAIYSAAAFENRMSKSDAVSLLKWLYANPANPEEGSLYDLYSKADQSIAVWERESTESDTYIYC